MTTSQSPVLRTYASFGKHQPHSSSPLKSVSEFRAFAAPATQPPSALQIVGHFARQPLLLPRQLARLISSTQERSEPERKMHKSSASRELTLNSPVQHRRGFSSDVNLASSEMLLGKSTISDDHLIVRNNSRTSRKKRAKSSKRLAGLFAVVTLCCCGTVLVVMRPTAQMQWIDEQWSKLTDEPIEPTFELYDSDETGAAAYSPRKDGRILLVPGEPHPIPALMRRAQRRYDHLIARQSTTFAHAVAEYKRRYQIEPPRGFDLWYAFARENNVALIDEYDMIDEDLKIFRAFSPESFRRRAAAVPSLHRAAWPVEVRNGEVSAPSYAHKERADNVVLMMSRFARYLPDMTLWYNWDDHPLINIPWEERARLEKHITAGLYDDDAGEGLAAIAPKMRHPQYGFAQTCPPNTTAARPGFQWGRGSRNNTGLEHLPMPDGASGTLIDSWHRTMDTCNNPDARHYHGGTAWVYPAIPNQIVPLLTGGVNSHFGDIHAVFLAKLKDEPELAWENRTDERLLFRGQTSGTTWDQDVPWINTQRSRLHIQANNLEGNRTLMIADEDDLLANVTLANKAINPAFFDVGMIGPPVQVKDDVTRAEMDKVYGGYKSRMTDKDAENYKYVIDVDGNTWSGRFGKLMRSPAAVIKATIYPEFFSVSCIPWLHYIPAQIDYTDLWDILAFFRGTPEGRGSHDELARQIALAGQKWERRHLRWQDAESYQFRLALEYARLWSDDRPSMTDVDLSIEPHIDM
ncbi:glycosyltransferase family 90 protein [Mixia osmundae IAM 14324]|uniref:Glycosyl transferase CAP10 domain-containing protein n=1 Tax=Mixia osmundae (strain CBS 9802 / IAM 14324 / JCM 22182 / KY 12970) TaxID=764103 RepID=G7DVQ6_MIXOS|nr:glycosyltransferase family 90 protein [Mixia osmundae IAM 14324]KEI39652.1 glycosyltransferase family 90 protein [Mixia osmundae IAM 14324]GAA94666.1 hypothetical protein E5Q_01319 [Mixia osmundae IAM 14324]